MANMAELLVFATIQETDVRFCRTVSKNDRNLLASEASEREFGKRLKI